MSQNSHHQKGYQKKKKDPGKGLEQKEPSWTLVEMKIDTVTMENSVEIPLKTRNKTTI